MQAPCPQEPGLPKTHGMRESRADLNIDTKEQTWDFSQASDC